MSRTFDNEHAIRAALRYLRDKESLEFPDDLDISDPNGIDIRNEAQWNAAAWNLGPTTSPKPSWAQLIVAYQHTTINGSIDHSLRYFRSATDDGRAAIIDNGFVTTAIGKIHIGGGIDRISGLLQMVENANEAGANLPHVIMRDGEQAQQPIWRQQDLRSILSFTAARINHVESAHNVVADAYFAQIAIRDDETATLDDREAAADKTFDLAFNYENYLREAMDAYDPDALPPDLPTLQDVLQERLEAAAMRKVKALKRAATNQGVLAYPACRDQETAERAIAEECVGGVLAIKAAEDAEEAKTEFKDAVDAIDRVTPLNTPHWQISGRDVAGGANPPTYIVTGRSIEITAKQPNADIPKRVTIEGIPTVTYKASGKPAPNTRTVRKHPQHSEWHQLDVTLPMSVTETVVITLEASNICGRSKIVVELSP